MQELHWTTPDGCASCRPALNYYLLCAWPGEYVDDQQSRFVNERMHANIQKDGTYSVVPRMWGGITNPRELRAIADVVEKYDAPMVKVTGGQRLDIFGIKKEDLPAVWADLNAAGMVSGHAYGKALRTVKTCVGSRMVPLRHPGFDRARRQDRADDLGQLDAAQVQDRGLGLPAQLRRGDDQGLRRGLRRLAATSCTSAATAASRSASPTCCARSRPRRRRSIIAPPSSSSTARRRTISSAPRRGSSASGSTMSRRAIVEDEDGRDALAARFRYSPAVHAGRSLGRSAPRAARATCTTATSPKSARSRQWQERMHDRRVARHRPGGPESRCAARGRCRCAAARRSPCSAPAPTGSTRWSTSARTSRGR